MMNLDTLIAQLQELREKHGGSCPVMINDYENGETWAASRAAFRVAKSGEYPEDYNMPAGYTFIEIR